MKPACFEVFSVAPRNTNDMTPESNPAVGDGLMTLLSLKCALLLMMLLLALIAQTHIKHPFSIASSQVGLEGRQQKQKQEGKNNGGGGRREEEEEKKGYFFYY